MENDIRSINERMKACDCGNPHHHVEMYGVVADGALTKVKDYVRRTGWSEVTVAVDKHTYAAAGQSLCDDLRSAGIGVQVCTFIPDERGDVMADASAVLQLLLHVSAGTDVLIACGSGTIHDIVRFVAAKTDKPFVSVPTAASVDGFTSAGAPLIIRGVKQTMQTAAPEAIFADLSILSRAPRELTAAGFADMLGKYTSLADWRVSHAMAGEPFCPAAYDVTKQALDGCVQAVGEIAASSKSGIGQLMEALIVSGLSMLAVDHSRPASGGEHHISHMWEMQCIQNEWKQLLHGAKVGAATVLLSGLYRRLAETGAAEGLFDIYRDLPSRDELAAYLRQVGGPAEPADLGIDSERVRQALHQAPDLRDRTTGLKYIREHFSDWLDAKW